MATVFYDHLIPWEKVETFLLEIQPTPEEKWELIEIIEETVHTEVLTIVLSHIPESTHEEFLDRFHTAPHAEEHLVFIKTHSGISLEEILPGKMQQFLDEVLAELTAEE